MITEKITEQADEEISENIGLQKPKRVRKSRKLAWNERQYGSGLLTGIFIGIIIGIPIDVAVAILSKMFVNWLIAW